MEEGVTVFSIFDSMGFLFGKITEQMMGKFNEELLPYHIDAKEYGILTVITSMQSSTQQQVGEVLRIDRTTMVKKVDHLEALGYIVRIKNSEDRRTYNLQLTIKGEHILKELWPVLQSCEGSVLSSLTEEERQNLNNIFTKLINAWRK